MNVAWIDDQSAYVGLFKRDQVAIALSTLSQSDTYKVMTYKKRQTFLEGVCAINKSPVVRKRKSMESMNSAVKKRRTNSFGELVYYFIIVLMFFLLFLLICSFLYNEFNEQYFI